MNFLAFLPILSLMMLVHELGHFVTARLFGITVQEFGFGLPPRAVGVRHAGITYSLNWVPFGAFVKMLGEEDPSAPGSFASKPRWVRAIVLAAGSGMNFLLAVAAFSLAFMVGLPTLVPDGPVKLSEVAPGSPAQLAGLRGGDVISGFNGQPVDVRRFRELTQQNLDTPVQVTVQRASGDATVTLTPRSQPPQGQGAVGVVLGANQLAQANPVQAVGLGLEQTVNAIGLTFRIPELLMRGVITPGEARPIGLPGMAQLTAQAVEEAVDTGFWFPIFMLTGMFSAGLSIANMLPIPALDGGRFLFVVIEWVRGRRIPPEREAAYHFVGIVVLLTLMLAISVNDILSPIPRVNWGTR